MLLEIKDVNKRFGGLTAIADLSLQIEEGKILGLIGPNGSGKTTLFNIISGVFPPNQGSIEFNGKTITGLKPFQICRMGIARTFQVARPFMNMTIAENVMTGCLHLGKSRSQARAEAVRVLEFVGLSSQRNERARDVNTVTQRLLELARALATGPRLLLLDEIMAGLNLVEIEGALATIRRINDQGIAVLLIEHVMQAVMTISERVTVLSYGEKIAEGPPGDIAKDKRVIKAYLGEEYVTS